MEVVKEETNTACTGVLIAFLGILLGFAGDNLSLRWLLFVAFSITAAGLIISVIGVALLFIDDAKRAKRIEAIRQQNQAAKVTPKKIKPLNLAKAWRRLWRFLWENFLCFLKRDTGEKKRKRLVSRL